jgi:hypothetical protein
MKRKGEGSLTSNGELPVRQERSNAIGRGAKETVEYSARGTTATATATALIDYCRQPTHSYISSFITYTPSPFLELANLYLYLFMYINIRSTTQHQFTIGAIFMERMVPVTD